jgi:hypothetical protein
VPPVVADFSDITAFDRFERNSRGMWFRSAVVWNQVGARTSRRKRGPQKCPFGQAPAYSMLRQTLGVTSTFVRIGPGNAEC